LCLSWKSFFVTPTAPSDSVGLAGTRTTNGVEPNRHISTCNFDRFARQKWDLGARAALPPHRPPVDEKLHGHRRVARTPAEFGGRSADAVATDMFVVYTTPAIPEAPVSEG
jgi:hypothetical protein